MYIVYSLFNHPQRIPGSFENFTSATFAQVLHILFFLHLINVQGIFKLITTWQRWTGSAASNLMVYLKTNTW
jgi:hypothetical protein